MTSPRTFVSFSLSDRQYYRLLQTWKELEHVNFTFIDQTAFGLSCSGIECKCKERIKKRMDDADKYVVLISKHTRFDKHVWREAIVAIEKGCTIIGVNLDNSRRLLEITTPPIIWDIGAIFIPFSAEIIAYALKHYKMHNHGAYFYNNSVYRRLGYSDGYYFERSRRRPPTDDPDEGWKAVGAREAVIQTINEMDADLIEILATGDELGCDVAVERVLDQLPSANSADDVQAILQATWGEWGGTPEHYSLAARKIWALLCHQASAPRRVPPFPPCRVYPSVAKSIQPPRSSGRTTTRKAKAVVDKALMWLGMD